MICDDCGGYMFELGRKRDEENDEAWILSLICRHCGYTATDIYFEVTLPDVLAGEADFDSGREEADDEGFPVWDKDIPKEHYSNKLATPLSSDSIRHEMEKMLVEANKARANGLIALAESLEAVAGSYADLLAMLKGEDIDNDG